MNTEKATHYRIACQLCGVIFDSCYTELKTAQAVKAQLDLTGEAEAGAIAHAARFLVIGTVDKFGTLTAIQIAVKVGSNTNTNN